MVVVEGSMGAEPRLGSSDCRRGFLVSPPNHSSALKAGVVPGVLGNKSSAKVLCVCECVWG